MNFRSFWKKLFPPDPFPTQRDVDRLEDDLRALLDRMSETLDKLEAPFKDKRWCSNCTNMMFTDRSQLCSPIFCRKHRKIVEAGEKDVCEDFVNSNYQK